MSKSPTTVVIKNARIGFPKVWTAERATEDSRPKFSLAAIMDPDTPHGAESIKACKAAQRHAAVATWGEKADNILKGLEKNRLGLRRGDAMTNDEGDVYAGFEGMVFAAPGRAESQGRPQVLDRKKNPIAEADGLIYGGCYADVVVDFYAVSGKQKGGNGVFCSLEIVRFREHGEAFGNAPKNADDYLDDLDDDLPSGSASGGGGMEDEDDDLV